MAPSQGSVARRSASRPAPAPHRPPLRIFEPRPRRGPSARRTWLMCATLVVGSLLTVVVGDTLLDQGQVRLAATEQQIAAATTVQKAAQVAVAAKAAPPVIVQAAEADGMVSPVQVVLLPQVPLDVPLPAPDTAPGGAVPTAPTASTAGSPSSARSSSTATPAAGAA